MSGSVLPAVDLGDTTGWAGILRKELKPTDGRLGNTIRLTAVCMLAIIIGECFRLPSVAFLAYISFIVANNEAGSTIRLALTGGAALIVATFASIGVFAISLSEPALRIALMSVLIFLTGFMSRAALKGPIFYVLGLWTVYQLPSGDTLIEDAAQQSYLTGNTTSSSIPDIAFMSPEEALLHSELWNAFTLLLALSIVVLVNYFAGRDPAPVARKRIRERIAAAADWCNGDSDARERLRAFAREGTGPVQALAAASKVLKREPVPGADVSALISAAHRLCLVLLAAAHLPEGTIPDSIRRTAAARCTDILRRIDGGNKPVSDPAIVDSDAAPSNEHPLALQLQTSLDEAEAALTHREKPENKASSALLRPDAWTNPEYVRHGLKLTICAMIVYLIERVTDWSGIHTCLVTCFVVALETNGASVHKMVMRIGGCVIGALLGLVVILLVMPHLTGLGDLLLAMAGPLLLAAWVRSGSPRSNYVGQQMAIAFFSFVLSGYGPTLNMEGGRDRAVGILLGDVLVFVVYASLWPSPVAAKVRGAVARALREFAALLGGEDKRPARDICGAIDAAIGAAQSHLVNDPFDPSDRNRRPLVAASPGAINGGTLRDLQALEIPALALRLTDPDGRVTDADNRYRADMAAWFTALADWVQAGTDPAVLRDTFPDRPDDGASDASVFWARKFHRDAAKLASTLLPSRSLSATGRTE